MDICKYFLELDGSNFTFNSDQELNNFIRDKLEFGVNPRAKYSKTAGGIETEQERVIGIISKGIDQYSKNYIKAADFLEEQHDLDNEFKYLSPVFIDKNYAEIAIESLIQTDKNLIELAKNDKPAAVEEATKIIEKELALDKRMKFLSGETSKLMTMMLEGKAKLNDQHIDAIFKIVAEYNNHDAIKGLSKEEKDTLIDTYVKANFTTAVRKNFKDEMQKWYNGVTGNSDLVLTKVGLSKQGNFKNNQAGITTRIPYVTVSQEGVSSIYQIKVSRKIFKEWHSAKKITTDYLLGINRQLLSNIVNIQSTPLYVQPVIFPEKGDQILLSNFFIEPPVDRGRYDSKAGLDEFGEITKNLRKILPATTIIDEAESKALSIENKEILDIMFNKYNVRTKTTASVDYIYNEIVNKAKDDSKLYLKDRITGKKLEEENTPEGRIRFKELVKDYVERSNKMANSHMIDLTKAIISAKKSTDKKIHFGRESLEQQKMFDKYLKEEWELIINRTELLDAGLLLFRNNMTGIVEVISITVNQLDQINNLSLGNTLLGQFVKNDATQHDDKILKASNTNIEIMKALVVLNSNPELLKGFSLNSIKVFNSLENKGDFLADLDIALHNFELLIEHTKKFKDVKNNFKGRFAPIKTTDFIKALYGEILNITTTIGDKYFKTFIDQLDNIEDLAEAKQKLDWLLKLREELIRKHKKLTDVDPSLVQDFNDPVEYLHYLISSGIAYYSNLGSVFDYDSPRYGISTGDATHWARSLLFGSAPDYDEKGNKIVGLFQGQHFNTTDALQSVYMTKLHDLITIAQNQIVSDFNKRKSLITRVTNDYYTKIGRNGIEKMLIGNADPHHEVFFEEDGTKISKEFKLKNPWDMTVNLTSPQRDYLKHFIYFQYLSRPKANMTLDTFEKFEKSGDLQKLLSSSKELGLILKVPLMTRQSIVGRIKNLTTDGLRKFAGQTWDSMVTALDDRDVTGEQMDKEKQKAGAYESINGFKRMYNQYEVMESEEFRDSLIDKYGVGHFEVNLDTIALKYAFESIRERHFNQILPALHAAVTTMKFYAWQTGKTAETTAALEDFFDQLKISVYNTSIMKGKEIEEALGVVKTAQKVVSWMSLVLRPALMIKELVVGQIKNASYAFFKTYGEDSFTASDLTSAYGLLLNKGAFPVVSELNTEYRIANRDLNQIVDKVKVDRTGLNFASNFLYWFNTAPDYVNRMSLFLAKLVHDGAYEAHSINEQGELVYDPSKDKRYSYYFQMRDKYNYEYHLTDTKYNDQRSRYEYAIKEFNAERTVLNLSKLTEKDNLPRAYFSKERDSIKTFSDTAYGYYDKERSPLIKHLPFGIVFGQFLTFWPSKVKYYLGKRNENTKRGYMNHKHKIVDGQKVYYYVRWSEDPHTGEVYQEEVPESELKPTDPKVKAWEWHGEPSEGLMYSLAAATRAVFKGELKSLSPQQIANSKLALHDLFVALLAMLIGMFLMTGDKVKDQEALGQYGELIMRTTNRAMTEFNPWLSIFGSIQTTPAFVTKLGTTRDSMMNLLEGKGDVESFFRRNISFLEIIPNPLTRGSNLSGGSFGGGGAGGSF